MSFYRQVPLLRIFLPYLLGVSWVVLFNLPHGYSLAGFLLSFCFLAIVFFYRKISKNYRWRWVYGIAVCVFLLFAGVEYADYVKMQHKSVLRTDTPVLAIANIVEKPVLNNTYFRAVVKIIDYKKDSTWVKTSEKVMAYFFKDSLSSHLKVGVQVVLQGAFSEISNAGNPDEFDYKGYMADQFIYKQIFLRPGDYKINGENKGNILLLYSDKVRNYCIQLFQRYKLGKDELAIASAMILGDRSFVGNELKQNYADSGTIHILSVSGQHVGVLFIFLSRLLVFLKKKKYLHFLIIILVLWSFAFISGLSPSVLRATVMFSFLQTGMAMRRQMNIYNTIIASAFLLLLVNPFVLLDAGCQLSYFAVWGIVFFHPKIYSLLKFKLWITGKTWELFSLSAAAQLGTISLVLFYFNKFPNYFIVSNLIVIPLAGIVIYFGIFALMFSFSYHLSFVFSLVLNYSVKAINTANLYVSKLPFAVTEVYIDVLQAIIIYGLIFFVSLFLVYKNRLYAQLAVICIFLFSVTCIYAGYKRDRQSQVVVYNIKGHTAIGFITGRDCIIVGDEYIMDKKKEFEKKLNRHRLHMGLKRINYVHIKEGEYICRNMFFYKQGKYIQFFNKRIILMDKNEFKNYFSQEKLNVDILILSGRRNAHVQGILKFLNVQKVIVDSSVPFYLADEYFKFCNFQQINCFSVIRSGAFLLEHL